MAAPRSCRLGASGVRSALGWRKPHRRTFHVGGVFEVGFPCDLRWRSLFVLVRVHDGTVRTLRRAVSLRAKGRGSTAGSVREPRRSRLRAMWIEAPREAKSGRSCTSGSRARGGAACRGKREGQRRRERVVNRSRHARSTSASGTPRPIAASTSARTCAGSGAAPPPAQGRRWTGKAPHGTGGRTRGAARANASTGPCGGGPAVDHRHGCGSSPASAW